MIYIFVYVIFNHLVFKLQDFNRCPSEADLAIVASVRNCHLEDGTSGNINSHGRKWMLYNVDTLAVWNCLKFVISKYKSNSKSAATCQSHAVFWEVGPCTTTAADPVLFATDFQGFESTASSIEVKNTNQTNNQTKKWWINQSIKQAIKQSNKSQTQPGSSSIASNLECATNLSFNSRFWRGSLKRLIMLALAWASRSAKWMNILLAFANFDGVWHVWLLCANLGGNT